MQAFSDPLEPVAERAIAAVPICTILPLLCRPHMDTTLRNASPKSQLLREQALRLAPLCQRPPLPFVLP